MFRRLLLAASCLAVFASWPARAAETQPGDSCVGQTDLIRTVGGPENPGTGYLLVCDGTVWKAVNTWDSASGKSLFQVNTDAGSCTTTKLGRLRYDGTSTWDYCNGTSWTALPGSTGGAGSTGYIQFKSSTGSLGGDSKLFWDDAYKRLGIGTSSPASLLDVNGGARIGYDSTACSAAKDGTVRYSSATKAWEYCNGSAWNPFKQPQCQDNDTGECYLSITRSSSDPEFITANIKNGVNILGVTGSYAGTAEVGYFVLTNSTYTGNLGGLAGANASCLTDLTNNNWNGKTTANTKGWLNSTHVKSFLCDKTTCNTLNINTPYQMAKSGDLAVGGEYIATDSSGAGPNNSSAWNTLTTFNANDIIGTNRAPDTAIKWGTTPKSATNANTCSGWTSTTGNGQSGSIGSTGTAKWDNGIYGCGNSIKLICLVNP